jgi:hypothetical protein
MIEVFVLSGVPVRSNDSPQILKDPKVKQQFAEVQKILPGEQTNRFCVDVIVKLDK